MRWLLFILVVFIGSLLDAGNLLNLLAVGQWHIRPSAMSVLLVFFAVHRRTHNAVILSFIIGLATDISGSQMGPHTVSYCLIGSLLNQLSEYAVPRRFTHQAVLIFAASLAAGIVAYWLGGLKTGHWHSSAYRILALTAVYSALIGPFFWPFLNRLNHLITSKTPQVEAQRGYLR